MEGANAERLQVEVIKNDLQGQAWGDSVLERVEASETMVTVWDYVAMASEGNSGSWRTSPTPAMGLGGAVRQTETI